MPVEVVEREFKESPMAQGVDEKIAWVLVIPLSWQTSATSVPASPSVVAKDEQGTNVSATVLTGAASIAQNASTGLYEITTPRVISLVDGRDYRLEVQWTDTGNTLEAWGIIKCREKPFM